MIGALVTILVVGGIVLAGMWLFDDDDWRGW